MLFKACLAALFITFTQPAACLAKSPEWEFIPPPGSGVVNVKDFGARGDGMTDDTAAISAAISANIDAHRYRSSPFIWFPNGTYLVSGPIESRVQRAGYLEGKVFSAGWRPMLVMIGQSRQGAIIRLKDQAPGYTDPAQPKWVIATGSESDKKDNYRGGGNRAFRHGILNLTVDVGTGNPGAVGIDFIANNRGTIDGVTIRAGVGSGHTGLGLTRAWPGPAMVHDVRIEGFGRGVALDHYQYGMTFENVQLSGQRELGIADKNNVLTMRHVEFEGNVPFYKATGSHAMLCLLDSSLRGTSAEKLAAITSAGLVNLRRVAVTGFAQALDDTSKGNHDLPAGVIQSHDQGFVLNTAVNKAAALNLPIEETPIERPGAGAIWSDGGSSGSSLQAAIDSGAEWIYLKPAQTVKLTETLILRGKLRLLLGMNGSIEAPPGEPALRVADGASPNVSLEHIHISGAIEHPSSRTFVLRHGDHGGVQATGSGKTHIMDVIGRGYQIGPRHTFFARQLNAEFGEAPLFTNAGTSWVLGFKMESSTRDPKKAPNSTPALLNKSGQLEVFGGLLYTLGSKREHAPLAPAFTNEQGQIAVSYRTNGIPDTHYTNVLRMGSFVDGVDLKSDKIKGPGAALLTDQR